MLFQRILALWDKTISKVFQLRGFGITGNEDGKHQWTGLIGVGRQIGVVGADGEVHTVMSYWSVHHYYDRKKLLKRVPVRKDLKDGERLATYEEIARFQKKFREIFADSSGLTILS